MPRVSLIVILHGDRIPLERLMQESSECYDELLVIHDGEDFQDVRTLVAMYGGRFIERPRAYSQEPHVPFALENASHDWILRFDSDEYPSVELRSWLKHFRRSEDVPGNVSGYRFICPAWNGRRAITRNWPNKYMRLFHRERVRLVGVAEQAPVADFESKAEPMRFHHEPSVASQGIRNILKPRNRQIRRNLVAALAGSPLNHPRWRYESDRWPAGWQQVKDHPIRTAFFRLVVWPPRQALAMILSRDFPWPSVFTHAAIFHACVCFGVWRQQRQPKEY